MESSLHARLASSAEYPDNTARNRSWQNMNLFFPLLTGQDYDVRPSPCLKTMRYIDPDRYAALKATGKLPSPKGVALSIIRLLQRDDFRTADLVQLVQSDPAIAGRILFFSNAAAFGRSRPIVSLQRAIVALGSFRVRDLVIGLSIMHNHKKGVCTAFDYEDFWGHSLATGIACQELARFAQITSEEIFTIGLLARVGELALATLFPDEYSGLLLTAREGRYKLTALEQQRFGMDHHELAASMLSEWGFAGRPRAGRFLPRRSGFRWLRGWLASPDPDAVAQLRQRAGAPVHG